MTNCFIINYNRLTPLKAMVEYLKTIPEINPIIIDNNSTYEPLIEYYKSKPCELELLSLNWGCCAFWQTNLMDKYEAKNGNYIITDSDLDISQVPTDFMGVLREGLNRYNVDKCGFSLRLDDLPKNTYTDGVKAREKANWGDCIDNEKKYVQTGIDTTFALYKSQIHSFSAVRTMPPYCARHLGWYYESAEQLPDDEKYYLANIKDGVYNDWSTIFKKHYGL